ncbi:MULTISPECIES: hypothetical protein [unclassified Streptomyces]|uniref:hypothetical protein n=1 Tax=unclassified Streptomyces TaxID=2593676 RepID=UPI0027808D7C|nr:MULTISPECIES: hypothetical protein [unclassified Streptomyces]MDQ0694459.1 hypothetical protein [Streptomyces sp. W4I9-2]MDX3484490.1 hypothetical protein [Streptomyces sp. ID05-18]
MTGSKGEPADAGGAPPPAPGAAGVLRTFAQHLGPAYRLMFRGAAWATLAGTVVLLAFAASWPAFVGMRRGAELARRQEDSYAPDNTEVPLLVAAGALPVLLGLAAFAFGVLHTAHSLAVTRVRPVAVSELWRQARRQAGRAAAVQAGRGVLVGGLALPGALLWSLADVALPAAEPLLGYVLLALLVPAVVALRVGLALAPAAAALEGLGATAALHRSWTLVQGAWWRTTICVVASAALTVGAYVALRYAVEPTDGMAHALALSVSSGNTYLAYAAAQLAPVAVALLLCALLTLPFNHTVLTVLYVRRCAERGLGDGAGVRDAQQSQNHAAPEP